jgi:hypothetical protein
MDQAQTRASVNVKLRTVDVAGSDAKLIIELRRAAVEDLSDAVIVGPPVAYDDTMGRAIDLAALPVILTQPLASDPIGRAGGHWAFALAPLMPQLAAREIDDAVRRGVLVPSLVLTNGPERIDPVAAALAAEMERRGLDPLTWIPTGSDGGVPPVVRSSLSVLRSVHCLAPITACRSVAREARSAGSIAMIYLPYLTSPNEHIKDDRDLAARAVWPSSRTLIPLPVLRAREDYARAEFLKTFGERHNVRPDIHAAIAYDALSLLAMAADRAGPDDRARLRDAFERITIPLIASSYSFTAERHAGPDAADLAYLRWEGGAPALAPTFGSTATTPAPARTASPALSPNRSP